MSLMLSGTAEMRSFGYLMLWNAHAVQMASSTFDARRMYRNNAENHRLTPGQ
jgi:hypothetical protein